LKELLMPKRGRLKSADLAEHEKRFESARTARLQQKSRRVQMAENYAQVRLGKQPAPAVRYGDAVINEDNEE
jgi:hypothetical protein